MNSLFTEDGIKKLTVRQCLAFEFPPYYGNDSVPYKILNAEGTSDINVLELKFLCRPPALYKMRANLKRNQGKAVYIPNPEIGTINGQDLDILINLSETKAKIQNITQLIKYVSESLRLPQSAELLKDMRLKCCLIPAPLRKEVQLDLSQLCCLMTYNWLVDSVIDSIFLFVHRQSWIDIPNIYFGGIDLSGSIQKVYRQRCTTDRNLKIWTEPIKKRLRTTPELELFLSWNHSSMHWGCVRIKFKHKTIEVFDSIRGTIPIRECKAMLEYYLEFYLNVEEMSLWKRKKVEIGVTPQQDDGHSCGIITINTIERLLGIDVEEWLPAKKEQHRHRILLLLMDAMELLDVQGKRKLQQLETELSGVGATMDPVPSQPSIFNNNEAQDSVPTQPSIFINNEAQDPVPSQQSTIINNEAQDPVHRQQAGITDDNAVVEKQVQADFPLLFTKEHITVDCHCSSVHPAIADLECQASKAGISIKILDAMIREEKFQSTMCTTTSCSKFSGNIEVIPKGSRFKSQQALNAVLQFGKRLKGIIVLQIWCGEWNEMIYFPRYSEGEPREFAVFCRKEEKTSLEVAFAEIQKWAVGNGFDITKGRSKGDGNGGIQSWRIQCPHSRKYAPRKHPDSAVHRNRKSGGTHCPFYVKIHLASQAKQVILNLQNTDTIITSFFLGHNHAVHPDDSAMLKSTCFFTKEMREEVMRLYKLKSSTDTILRTLRLKYPTKTITVKAIHNARLGMGAGSAYDAEEFVKALERAKEEDPAFLYFTDIDAITGQLRRAFWCHPRQLELIRRYHDVVSHDNTAKKNRYNLPLSLFVSINHNRNVVLLAQGVVSDETADSYVWLFKCFTQAVASVAPHHHPKVLITDSDTGVDCAVPMVFPDSIHLHCIFHVMLNLAKNLKSTLGGDYKPFITDFYNCKNALCEEVFTFKWRRLLQKYPNTSNYLESVLWPTREKWAWPWVGSIFTAGMKTTSISESQNAIFRRVLTPTTPLTILFEEVKNIVRNQKEAEQLQQFKFNRTKHNLKSPLPDFESIFTEVVNCGSEFVVHKLSKEISQSENYMVEACDQLIPMLSPEVNEKDGGFTEFGIPNFHSDTSEADHFYEIDNLITNLDLNIDNIEDSRRISLEALLMHAKGSIQATFKVYTPQRPESPQIVHVLSDRTFVCSCLLLVNGGYPCRHYFALVKNRKIKFHVSLINPRWFTNAMDPESLSQKGFLEAQHPRSFATPIDKATIPISNVISIRRNQSSPAGPKKLRYSRLLSLSRNVADFVSGSPTKSAMWEDFLRNAHRIDIDRLGKLLLSEEKEQGKEVRPVIVNPPLIKTKGRPRAKRYKSSVEANGKRKRNGIESPGNTPEKQPTKRMKSS